jgi:hypothetical protein
MSRAIRFTRHARGKFDILAEYGYPIAEEQVRDTLLSPDRIEDHQSEQIAQKRITNTHVLRVVYRLEGEEMIVITFYPGRRQRYEDNV